MKIKEIPTEFRPREKAIQHGIESLSDVELLALLIGSGVKGCSAIDIARNLLSTYPNLLVLANSNLVSLEEHFGLSKSTSLKLLATFEFHHRLISPQYQKQIKIITAEDVYLRYKYLENYSQEVLVILMLSRDNRIIKEKILYKGTENQLNINPTEICAELILSRCKKYILVHNHPNGESSPSEEDEYTTEIIKRATDSIQVSFVDHVIIYPFGYCSIKQESKHE